MSPRPGRPFPKASVRVVVSILVWCLLFGLPAMRAAGGLPGPGSRRGERAFLARTEAGGNPTLGRGWYLLFGAGSGDEARRAAAPKLGVAAAWILLALGLGLSTYHAGGERRAAAALLLLAVHPAVGGPGALAGPWLPAAAFVFVALTFLQGLVLPPADPRRRGRRRLLARGLALLGAALSAGLAVTAEGGVAWIVLVPTLLCFLALLAAARAFLALRPAGGRLALLPLLGPALVRRAGPWALAWFLLSLAIVGLDARLGHSVAPAGLVPGPAGGVERLLAWLAAPCLVVLAWRESAALALGSRLRGRTVLLVGLVLFWARGPALDPWAGPTLRILGAPVAAAALALAPALPGRPAAA